MTGYLSKKVLRNFSWNQCLGQGDTTDSEEGDKGQSQKLEKIPRNQCLGQGDTIATLSNLIAWHR